jgi:iron-sulfur cluster assembly protein CyaY
MDESAFIAAADATLDKIGLALDAALETSDADLDWSVRDGVLTIECDDASRIIVNRHVPNREIWVAAKSGGLHFRPYDGRWRDARGEEELGAALTRLIRTQAHVAVRMPELSAPTSD